MSDNIIKVNEVKAVESHPLKPFLPENARVFMLGTFPPKRERWSMDFFYPNFQNDMWRIVGYVFENDKSALLLPGQKKFDEARIRQLCAEKGIALSDTAVEVVRHKDNASDKFLEVVTPVDFGSLLSALPECRAVVTTGQKATDTLLGLIECEEPPVGGSSEFVFAGRNLRLYRMPSSSRAYPKPVEEKAEYYRKMFEEVGLL